MKYQYSSGELKAKVTEVPSPTDCNSAQFCLPYVSQDFKELRFINELSLKWHSPCPSGKKEWNKKSYQQAEIIGHPLLPFDSRKSDKFGFQS